MTIYSFRAECPHDVKQFLKSVNKWPEETTPELIPNLVSQRDSVMLNQVLWGMPASSWPDVNIEIRSELTLADLRLVLCAQEDSHVMLETLREVPLAENNLERDFSFWPDEDSPEHIQLSQLFIESRKK